MNEREIAQLQERLVVATTETVVKVVNGKIDRLHKEVIEANRKQDEKLDALHATVSDVVELYGNGSAFLRGIVTVSKFVMAVGGAVGVVWGVFKYLVLSATQVK